MDIREFWLLIQQVRDLERTNRAQGWLIGLLSCALVLVALLALK